VLYLSQDGVVKLLWSPASQIVYTGSLDGKVRAWDYRTGNCERVFQGHADSILDLAISRYLSSSLPLSLIGFNMWLFYRCFDICMPVVFLISLYFLYLNDTIAFLDYMFLVSSKPMVGLWILQGWKCHSVRLR